MYGGRLDMYIDALRRAPRVALRVQRYWLPHGDNELPGLILRVSYTQELEMTKINIANVASQLHIDG